MTEHVLLIHGLGRTRRSLSRLCRFLVGAGFTAHAWSYPSWRRGVAAHGESLAAELRRLGGDPAVERIHLVGHSLGGILIRYALARELPETVGRSVMLAPPNRGSRWARRLAPLLGRLVRPLPELSDAPESAVNRLPAPENREVGIIAAACDLQVRGEDTHLIGETAHMVVPGSHTFIMNRLEVHEAVARFLRTGRF